MWGMNLLLFPLTDFSCEIPRGDNYVLKVLFCLSVYCMILSLHLNVADHFKVSVYQKTWKWGTVLVLVVCPLMLDMHMQTEVCLFCTSFNFIHECRIN